MRKKQIAEGMMRAQEISASYLSLLQSCDVQSSDGLLNYIEKLRKQLLEKERELQLLFNALECDNTHNACARAQKLMGKFVDDLT